MKNQTSFRLTTTLLPTDTTAKTTQVINKVDSEGEKFYPTFTEETVVLTNDDRTVMETTRATCTNWVLTFVKRGLSDDNTEEQVENRKLSRNPWTLCFITAGAWDWIDKDDDIEWTGKQTYTGELVSTNKATYKWQLVTEKWVKYPSFATLEDLNAYADPFGWMFATVDSTWELYRYNAVTEQWDLVSTVAQGTYEIRVSDEKPEEWTEETIVTLSPEKGWVYVGERVVTENPKYVDVELVWWWWGWSMGSEGGSACACFSYRCGGAWWGWMVSCRQFVIKTPCIYNVIVWEWWKQWETNTPWCNGWDTKFWEITAYWWWGVGNARATGWGWGHGVDEKLALYGDQWYSSGTWWSFGANGCSWHWWWWAGSPWESSWKWCQYSIHWWNWRKSFIDWCWYWAWAGWANCGEVRCHGEWWGNCWSWWFLNTNWTDWIVLIRYPKDWSYWYKCAMWWIKKECWDYIIHCFTEDGTFEADCWYRKINLLVVGGGWGGWWSAKCLDGCWRYYVWVWWWGGWAVLCCKGMRAESSYCVVVWCGWTWWIWGESTPWKWCDWWDSCLGTIVAKWWCWGELNAGASWTGCSWWCCCWNGNCCRNWGWGWGAKSEWCSPTTNRCGWDGWLWEYGYWWWGGWWASYSSYICRGRWCCGWWDGWISGSTTKSCQDGSNATNCWWWGWGAGSYYSCNFIWCWWNWWNWVVDVCYIQWLSSWITCATGGNCCYTCNWYCVHRFTSDWTFCIVC